MVRKYFIILFAAVIAFGVFKIWEANHHYRQSRQVSEYMQQYRPAATVAGEFVNQSIVDAKAQYPDLIGWLYMHGTRIDYPFVQAADNDYYLRRNIDGEYAFAGTLFMDAGNDSGFGDFLTIIYGHNLENTTKFSDISRYDNADFFAQNTVGTIYLPYATYTLEIFAYMRIEESNRYIYGLQQPEETLEYIAQNAWRYRDISVDTSDRIVVLSTCTRAYDTNRNVLIARLT